MSSNGNKNLNNNQQPRYQQQAYYNSNTNPGHQNVQQNQTANPNGYQIHHVQQIPMSVMAAAAAATTQNLKGPPQSSDYHVQQCLVQGPPPHSQQHTLHTSHPPFRIVHQRDGGYQVTTSNASGYPNQSGGPQQPSQIRGLPPNAPPTPPQSDMKISGGQPQMVHSYVQGRNTNQNIYRPNQNQPPRSMARQPMMATQPFMPMQPIHPIPYSPQQYTLAPRQTQPQIYSPNQFNIMPPYNCNFYQVQTIPHSRPMSAPNLSNNTPPQGIGIPPNVLTSTPQVTNQPRKRRPNALKIEDPASGKDVLEEVFGEEPSQTLIAPVQHSVALSDAIEFDQQHHELNNPLPDSNVMYNLEPQLQSQVVQQQPPPPQHSRAIPIQDALSETPVVSAQQDGPSIEIITKQSQTTKKVRKPTTAEPSAPHANVSKLSIKNGVDKSITASPATYDATIANTGAKIIHTSPRVLQQIQAEKEKVLKESNKMTRPIVTSSPPLEPPKSTTPTSIQSAPVAVKAKTNKHNKSVTASLKIYDETITNPNPKERILYASQFVIDALDLEKERTLEQELEAAAIARALTPSPTGPITIQSDTSEVCSNDISDALYETRPVASTIDKIQYPSFRVVQQIDAVHKIKSNKTEVVRSVVATWPSLQPEQEFKTAEIIWPIITPWPLLTTPKSATPTPVQDKYETVWDTAKTSSPIKHLKPQKSMVSAKTEKFVKKSSKGETIQSNIVTQWPPLEHQQFLTPTPVQAEEEMVWVKSLKEKFVIEKGETTEPNIPQWPSLDPPKTPTLVQSEIETECFYQAPLSPFEPWSSTVRRVTPSPPVEQKTVTSKVQTVKIHLVEPNKGEIIKSKKGPKSITPTPVFALKDMDWVSPPSPLEPCHSRITKVTPSPRIEPQTHLTSMVVKEQFIKQTNIGENIEPNLTQWPPLLIPISTPTPVQTEQKMVWADVIPPLEPCSSTSTVKSSKPFKLQKSSIKQSNITQWPSLEQSKPRTPTFVQTEQEIVWPIVTQSALVESHKSVASAVQTKKEKPKLLKAQKHTTQLVEWPPLEATKSLPSTTVQLENKMVWASLVPLPPLEPWSSILSTPVQTTTASLAIYDSTINNPNSKECILYAPKSVELEKLDSEQRLEKEASNDKSDSINKSEDASIIISVDNKDSKSLEQTKSDFINNNLSTAQTSETILQQVPPSDKLLENTQLNMTTIETQSVIEQMNNLNNNIDRDIPDITNNNINIVVESDIIVSNNDKEETVPLVQQESDQITPSTETVAMSDSCIDVSNEPSAISISEEITLPTKKDLIEYEEGQWSPNNQEGKKAYSIDQLRKLKDLSVCLTKPDVKEHEVVLRDLRSAHSRNDSSGGFQYNKYMGGGGNTGNTDNIFLPNFARTNSNRIGGGRDYGSGKRVSQTGNKQQGGGKSSSKTGMIHVSLSLREEVKLNETENAWKPSMLLDSADQMTKEERSEQELFKRVRGILNKLTPEKFTALIHQMKHLTIDTQPKLSGVIKLIFEKAVDEPNFSIAYAQMCSNLSSISINAGNQNQMIFQKILLVHCQKQFEDIGSDKHIEFRKRLDECKDPEKRLELEEEERKIRRRSVGTTRFVGELFKFEMLTFNIMLKCLNQMLVRKNEESLECLCKLLTTIGKNLTAMIDRDEKVGDKQQLQKIFDEMDSLTTNKQFKINSRVRFMLQDVLDLKRSNWNPRRQDLNPKKMGEILKEAENEQLNIQLMNYQPTGGRKDEGRRPGGPGIGGQSGGSNSMSYLAGGRSVSEDGWSTQTSKGSRAAISNIDPKKLQTSKLNITNNMALGSASYYKWSTRQQTPIETPTTNKFSALLDSQKSKRPFTSGGSSSSSRNKDSYHSRDSLERYDRPQSSRLDTGTFSRNSQSRDSYSDSPIMRAPPSNKLSSSSMISSSSQSNEPLPQIRAPSPLDTGASAFVLSNRSLSGDELNDNSLPEPTKEVLKMMHSFDIFEEYCNNITSMDECEIEIQRIPPEYRWCIPRELYCHVLEHKRKHRIKISEIFVYAIKKYQSIKLNHFIYGLQKYLDLTEDFSIDYPKIWEYVAEMLGPLLRHKIINLKDLVNVASIPIAAKFGGPMLINLFDELLGEYGPKFIRDLWKSSDVQWSDFIEKDETEFINSNNLQYVTQSLVTPPNPKRKLDMTEFQEKLLSLLNIQTPYDEIIEWISVNVEKYDNNFIRTLTTAILKFSLEKTNSSYKLNIPVFEGQLQLLRRYIENSENNELQCLYAIQRLINTYEHPAGVLRVMVERLYEEDIISLEGFTNWKHSTDPNEQEGKGVSQSSLFSFFTSLNELSSDDNIEESDNKDSKN